MWTTPRQQLKSLMMHPTGHVSRNYVHRQLCCDWAALLDSDRLGQVTREIHIKALEHGKPICNQLQGNDIEQTLQTVNRLGNFNLLRLGCLKFGVGRIAKHNGLATTSNDYRELNISQCH